MALPVDAQQPLTPDEHVANEILQPFGIQIVYVGGNFTLRGNQVGLDAAYLHVETSRQIPQSVKAKINVFLGSFDTALARRSRSTSSVRGALRSRRVVEIGCREQPFPTLDERTGNQSTRLGDAGRAAFPSARL